MCGSETASGLSRKRSSLSASGTTNTSDCKIAVEQKAMSREVSEASMPTRDLNHWRSSSTREMRADGRFANKRGQQGEVVEGLFRVGIEDGVLLQGGDSACFVDWLCDDHDHLLTDSFFRVGSCPGRNPLPNTAIRLPR